MESILARFSKISERPAPVPCVRKVAVEETKNEVVKPSPEPVPVVVASSKSSAPRVSIPIPVFPFFAPRHH